MSTLQLLDAAGRRRSPATLPGFHAGRPPRNKGFRYPPDPPRVEEIIAVMRRAGEQDHRVEAAGADRGPLASGTSDRRGNGADRTRPRSEPRLDLGSPGQGWRGARSAWTIGASISSSRGSRAG